MSLYLQRGPIALAVGPRAAVLALGSLALVLGRDRYGQPFAEVARGARPIPAAQTIVTSAPRVTATLGAWPVKPTVQAGQVAIGRLWINW